MKWLVGSWDSKAAETQTVWPRALSPEELSSPKSYHEPRPAWKKMPQCMLPAQAKFRSPTLSRPGGEGKVKTQSSVAACSFPILTLCGNNQELQNIGQPSLYGSRIALSVSSFPYLSGRCGPHLFLFAGFSF